MVTTVEGQRGRGAVVILNLSENEFRIGYYFDPFPAIFNVQIAVRLMLQDSKHKQDFKVVEEEVEEEEVEEEEEVKKKTKTKKKCYRFD